MLCKRRLRICLGSQGRVELEAQSRSRRIKRRIKDEAVVRVIGVVLLVYLHIG